MAWERVSFVDWTAKELLRILGNMRSLSPSLGALSARSKGALAIAALAACAPWSYAQTCTTQAKMTAEQRAAIGTAAFDLASAVQSNNEARVHAGMVAQYAGDPNQTAYLIRSTASAIAGDMLAVTQAYLLDASARKPGDTTEADFACPLTGSSSETDFNIAGLPAGRFAFTMVEARGNTPWLLAFLLEQEGGSWKMAGFYPHPRAVAGHDGLWYWTSARAAAKADKPWLAWVLYGEADQLLRPAAFASSANLDKLRSEQRSAAPEPLANGLSAETPLSLQGQGAVYRVTELRAQSSDDAKTLNLFMRIEPGSAAGTLGQGTAMERNVAAARALLAAHPELRQGFDNIYIEAVAPGAAPVTVERPIQEIAAVGK